MSVIGTPRKFHTRLKFLVEFDGFTGGKTKSHFQKMSELSLEVAKIEHYEGARLIPYKLPGRVTVPDITLERGVTKNQDVHDWMLDVVDIAANKGLVDPSYMRMGEVIQLDRDNSVLRRYRLHSAWPVKYVAGEWNNDTDEVNIEMLTLAFDYFELINLES